MGRRKDEVMTKKVKSLEYEWIGGDLNLMI